MSSLEDKLVKKYSSISPYLTPDSVQAALGRLKKNPSFFEYLIEKLGNSKRFSLMTNPPRINCRAIENFYPVINSWQDCQTIIGGGILIPFVIQASISNLTYSGLEKLKKGERYVFISNHRDILLDAILVSYGVFTNRLGNVQNLAGSNLYVDQTAVDLFSLMGIIKVFRDLPTREQYEKSVLTSSYISDIMANKISSVWVAGSAGRSKDGFDFVKSAVVKMITMQDRKKPISEQLKKYKIVPVTISYEYDPSIKNKAHDMTLSSKTESNKKEKRPYDDVISMVKGLKANKGNVHINYSSPIEGEFSNYEELSLAIQNKIRTGYKFFSTNYISYDLSEGTERFKDRYTKAEKKMFMSYYGTLKKDDFQNLCKYYSNPIRATLEINPKYFNEN